MDTDTFSYLPTVRAPVRLGRHIFSTLPAFDMRYLDSRARIQLFHRIPPSGCRGAAPPKTKKAHVAEYRRVFGHVGLLVNEPPVRPSCSSSSHPSRLLKLSHSMARDGRGKIRCRKPLTAIQFRPTAVPRPVVRQFSLRKSRGTMFPELSVATSRPSGGPPIPPIYLYCRRPVTT